MAALLLSMLISLEIVFDCLKGVLRFGHNVIQDIF